MIYNFDILALAAIATVVATQILKSTLIPVPFQKYPRTTAALASLGASVWAVYQTGFDVLSTTKSTVQFLAFVFATLLISAVTYNNVVKKPTDGTTTF